MKEREEENDARIGTEKAIWILSATKHDINTLSALLLKDGKKALEIHSCNSCKKVTDLLSLLGKLVWEIINVSASVSLALCWLILGYFCFEFS
jgi:hypothetical protein